MTSILPIGDSYFKALFKHSPVATVTLDSNHEVVSVNSAFTELFGFSEEDLIGKNLDDYISDTESKKEAQKYTASVQSGSSINATGRRKRKDGSLIDVEIKGVPVIIENEQVGALALYLDITQRLVDLRRMSYLATTDELTGLLNRRAITEIAEAELAIAHQRKTPLSIAMMDLDNLKQINDSHGHLLGDEALILVSKTLSSCCRQIDYVGRWGGDEFLAVFPSTDNNIARKIVDRICTQLEKAALMTKTKETLPLSLSAGIASIDQEVIGISFDELIMQADRALYEEKHQQVQT